MSKTLAIPLLALALAGCATQVPQALPPQMVPNVFIGTVPAAAQVWPEVSWWKTFGDPQLAALVETAQDQNRDIAIAVARVMQAEAQSTIQRSALFRKSARRVTTPTAVAAARAASASAAARPSASVSTPAMNSISGVWRVTICAPPMNS
jgi:outer membrane protein TolC